LTESLEAFALGCDVLKRKKKWNHLSRSRTKRQKKASLNR
ncbi:unnamed protein product, partial [Amoebophrya sp. A25]